MAGNIFKRLYIRISGLFLKLKYCLHLNKVRPIARSRFVQCSHQGVLFTIECNSQVELFRAKTFESKEPVTLRWIDTCFHSGETLFDIGANIGLYSLYAALRYKNEIPVFAFEPEALNFAKLNRNIFINKLSKKVISYPIAIHNKLDFDLLYLNESKLKEDQLGVQYVPGTALHNYREPVDQFKSQFKPLHVHGAFGVSLDMLCYEFNFPIPNHLKIDVDGNELKILEGAKKLLQDVRLKTICIEFPSVKNDQERMSDLLRKNNFKLDPLFYEPFRQTDFQLQNSVFTRSPQLLDTP